MSQPIRVLHVSHQWHEGGSALYAAALADEMARQGAHVRRFGPDDVKQPRQRGFAASFGDPAVDSAFAFAAAGMDVVHFHHLSGLSMHLPRVAQTANAKVVFTLHDYWLGCARGQLVNDVGERCCGWSVDRCSRCVATHLWAPLPARVAKLLPRRTNPVRARHASFERIKRNVDQWFSPSTHVATRMGVTASVLQHPLLGPIAPAPHPGSGPVRFLFLGSLVPTKGADVLLQAFASLPARSATLRIVGPAPPWNGRTNWAEALVRRIGQVPGASSHPFVPPAEVERELHGCDVLCVPSTWEENAPTVITEAAAAGLRIVASDVGGVREISPSATLVEPGAVEAWRNALAAEVRRGRGRVSPVLRESLAEHSATLLLRYADLLHRG